MDSLKHFKTVSLTISYLLVANLSAQSIDDFLGDWLGTESLTSPHETFENHNVSIQIEPGGDRDGFHIYTSSSDFIYNESLSWAFHYFGLDKDEDQLIFFRRFVTSIGHLGFDEKRYDILFWDGNVVVAEYVSHNGQTTHLLRVNLQSLGLENNVASHFWLSQNFPNPFNPNTTIQIHADVQTVGSLTIFDLNGREIKTLKNGVFTSGNHTFQWNGTNQLNQPVSAGTYIYRFMADDFVQSHKMVLLK